MRRFVAWALKFLFRIRFIRRYYFAFYKYLFRPTNLFRGITVTCRYNHTLKIRAHLEDWIQQRIFFTGAYDPASLGFISRTLSDGDTFIDIGANMGCFTLVGSELVGSRGRVIAFEPIENVAVLLEQNVRMNGQENVTIVKKAVYEENTVLPFYLARKENLGMSSMFRHDTESGSIVNVDALTLDSYLKSDNITKLKLIKIDIEGAELPALRGMERTIDQFKPILLVEISPAVIHSSGERSRVFQYLEKKNYDRFVVQADGELFRPGDDQLNDYTNYLFLQRS
jgi:FkbM family methyltransferase